MLERILGPLPSWAKTDHPFLRYELKAHITRRRPVYWLLLGLGALVLGAVGFITGTQLLTEPLSPNLTESMNRLVYAPVLILQIFLIFSVLSVTTGAVAESIRRQQWDNLRATESGAALALRSRWAAVFYRLRLLLGAILVLRIALIAGILYDLTAFQGQYLDLLLSGIVPQMSIPITPELDLGLTLGVVLLALTLTAGVLLPFTNVALDAATGLLLSTFVQQRTYNALLQVVLIVARFAVMAALGYGYVQFMAGDLSLPDGLAWLLTLGFGAITDWGLRFLHLATYGEIWAVVPYAVFLGLALVVLALIQAFIANRVLLWAIKRAQSSS